MSQFYIDCILFDPYLVDGHIVRQWPAEELTGTHIVSGEVPWAYDDIAFELSPGEGGPVMTARVADGVEEPCHVDQQQPLPVGDDHLHLAWGELGHLGHGNKSRHGPPLLVRLSWILHSPGGTPPKTLPPLHTGTPVVERSAPPGTAPLPDGGCAIRRFLTL